MLRKYWPRNKLKRKNNNKISQHRKQETKQHEPEQKVLGNPRCFERMSSPCMASVVILMLEHTWTLVLFGRSHSRKRKRECTYDTWNISALDIPKPANNSLNTITVTTWNSFFCELQSSINQKIIIQKYRFNGEIYTPDAVSWNVDT